MNTDTKRRNRVYRNDLKERARKNRNNMTEPEKRIWNEVLRGFKYRVARQKPLGQYIADFYCAKLKLVIEVDGESHYLLEGIQKDMERDEYFRKQGLKVIRFTNSDVMSNIEGVWEVINGHEL